VCVCVCVARPDGASSMWGADPYSVVRPDGLMPRQDGTWS